MNSQSAQIITLAPDTRQQVRDALLEPLERLRQHVRIYLLVEGLLRLAAALCVAGIVQVGLDRGLRLSVDQRAVLNVIITLFWLWVIWHWLVRPLSAPLPDSMLAGLVDRRFGSTQDRLAAAVQFVTGGLGPASFNSPQLVKAVVEEACQQARGLDFRAVLDHAHLRRQMFRLAQILLIMAAAFLLAPSVMGTWFQRNWLLREIPWPQQTYLRPVGFDDDGVRRAPLGEPFELEVLVDGRTPRTATIDWWTDAARDTQAMTRVGDSRFVAPLGVIDANRYFRLSGGDEHSPMYVLQAEPRPRIERISAVVTAPSYTGLADYTLDDATTLEAPAGSRILIRVTSSKPARIFQLKAASGEWNLPTVTPTSAEIELTAIARTAPERASTRPSPSQEAESGPLEFLVIDENGWSAHAPVRTLLKVLPDLAPSVTLKLPGAVRMVTPRARLIAQAHAKDEYGLTDVNLTLRRGEEQIELPLPPLPNAREFAAQATADLGPLRVAPGDRLRLRLEATDNDPTGPNTALGEEHVLEVLSMEDFLVAMARRELELRREFDRLIVAQRTLHADLERTLSETNAPTAAQRLSGLERRQQALARRVDGVRERFEQVLEERSMSQALPETERRRLTGRVIEPLQRISEADIPAAASAILEARDGGEPQADAALDSQVQVESAMRQVLDQMLEWEGYREVIGLLEQIIAEQASVHDQTRSQIEDRLEDILGPSDDLPTDSAPAPEP